jgi:hypothetical protein
MQTYAKRQVASGGYQQSTYHRSDDTPEHINVMLCALLLSHTQCASPTLFSGFSAVLTGIGFSYC